MLIETGYVYHIKEEYFKVAKDKKLMRNHENGNTRPTYLCIRNANVIGKYRKKYATFLIQNIFPVTEEYIDHIDTSRDKAVPVVEGTQREIIAKVNKVFRLKNKRDKSNIPRCR